MERHSSRVIPGTGPEEVRHWSPPRVEGDLAHCEAASLPPEPPTAQELEAIRRQAWEEGREAGYREGFDSGRREGLEAGRGEITRRLERLDALMATLDTPLKQLDDDVEQELITLVITMVKQLVRREIQLHPEQIVGVIREALEVLPVNSRHVRVILNPEDAELVRETYTLHESELRWKIKEDPVIQRGGCRVLTETSHVDASLETRIARLVAPLLGDQRQAAEQEGETP